MQENISVEVRTIVSPEMVAKFSFTLEIGEKQSLEPSVELFQFLNEEEGKELRKAYERFNVFSQFLGVSAIFQPVQADYEQLAKIVQDMPNLDRGPLSVIVLYQGKRLLLGIWDEITKDKVEQFITEIVIKILSEDWLKEL